MLNRTRRLLGLAKSSSRYSAWDDPRTPDGSDSPRPTSLAFGDELHPDWQADLASLFRHVDSRLAERRAIVSVPPEEAPNRRKSAPSGPMMRALPEVAPPEPVPASKSTKERWLGFGLEEQPPGVVEEPGPVDDLAGQVVARLRATLLNGEITAAVREAARDAVEEALRDRLGAVVRAGVEAALREAALRETAERQVVASAAGARESKRSSTARRGALRSSD